VITFWLDLLALFLVIGCASITFMIIKKYQNIAAKLQETTDQLQVMEKYAVVGQLSAGLAHEIRNPLTSIKGFIQLLQSKYNEGMDKEYIEIIINELDRVNNLVKEFLVLAKPTEPRRSQLNLHNIIKETVLLMESEAILHDIVIKQEAPVDLPLVSLDQEQIKQVFINLIHNAIEAIGSQGVIEIKAQYIDEKIVLMIRDDGPGIPENLIPKIFNPFVTTKAEGTGLGLSVTKRIIENHGGKITLQSQIGFGTTVTIEFPAN